MPNIRPTHKKSEWNITKHEFYTAYHYALQYDDWKNMIEAESNLSAIVQSGMPHGSGTSDPTYTKALKISEYRDKMRLIEETVREAGEEIYIWLLCAVTNENCTFNYLSTKMNIPCGQTYYYDKRRKFYYLLSKKI